MAKSQELIKEGVIDTMEEHMKWHQSFHSDCSECYKENRLIQAQRLVNSVKHPELRKEVNIPKIEKPPKDWAKNIMNKIIWGDNRHFYD